MKIRLKIEYAIVALSVVIIVGLIGTLIVLDLQRNASNPRVVVKLLDAKDSHGGVAARYEIRNESDTSLVDVQIRATVAGESVEQLFAHLPAWSERRGAVIFYGTKKHDKPEFRVVGYLEP